jgi:hypothetical protein
VHFRPHKRLDAQLAVPEQQAYRTPAAALALATTAIGWWWDVDLSLDGFH